MTHSPIDLARLTLAPAGAVQARPTPNATSARRDEPTGGARLLAIVGPSGAGKTTIARQLTSLLGGVLVSEDDFPLEAAHRPSRELLDKYDHAELATVVDRLLAGQPVAYTPFDGRERRRLGRRALTPRPVIVVEGICALHTPLIEQRVDVAIYVDAPAEVREARQRARLDREGLYRDVPRAEVLAAISRKRFEEDPIIERQRPSCDLVLLTDSAAAEAIASANVVA